MHTLKAGESLASVALKLYGDARYAKLIHTINRGDIPTRGDGFSTFAFVSPGQQILLPTYEEANIFARHFFTPQSNTKFDLAHFARPAMPSDSIPVNILPSQGSKSPKFAVATAESALQKLLPALPYLQEGGSGSGTYNKVAAGAESDQFQCQYIVRLSEQSQDNEVIDMSPPTVNVPRLQEAVITAEGPEVVAFSHYCRMIKFDAEGGQSDTIIKLQVLEETRWQTITAYIITEQTSRRLAHYAEKEQRAVNIDLPSAVARELSISDLKRNWKEYVRSYLSSQSKGGSFAADHGILQAC
jgi:hypothetical protein